MKNNQIWNEIACELEKDIQVILLVVVKTDGHAPGEPGFKMAVSLSGRRYGTIGGGQVEYNCVSRAEAMLRQGSRNPAIENVMLDDTAARNRGGMICGGKMTIALIPLFPEMLPKVNDIQLLFRSHSKGSIHIHSQRILSSNQNDHKKTFPEFRIEPDGEWEYSEQTGHEPVIHIIGGGHVSLALSRALSELNYYVIVYDERMDVETLTENTYANEKINKSFTEIHTQIPETQQTYIIIMTPSHQADELVLRQVISKEVPYIGMMASPRKRSEIVGNMLSDGFSQAMMSKLRSPIGLPIHSNTPAEIAISIAAELISIINAS